MHTKAFPSGSRATLVLALLVLAAIVTGVAASATNTVIPKQLSGRWVLGGDNYGLMVVSPRGRVEINKDCSASASPTCLSLDGYATFSRVTAHRLTISYVEGLTLYRVPPCSRTGTYRWKFTNIQGASDHLKLTKIYDACKRRVHLFAGTWLTTSTAGAP